MNKKLRQIRESKGFTQEDVAKKIGRSKQWLSEVERGNIDLKFSVAVQLSNIYGGTPDIFL